MPGRIAATSPLPKLGRSIPRPLKLSMNTPAGGTRAFSARAWSGFLRSRSVERMPMSTSVQTISCSKDWSRTTWRISTPFSASVRAAQEPAMACVGARPLIPDNGCRGLGAKGTGRDSPTMRMSITGTLAKRQTTVLRIHSEAVRISAQTQQPRNSAAIFLLLSIRQLRGAAHVGAIGQKVAGPEHPGALETLPIRDCYLGPGPADQSVPAHVLQGAIDMDFR
jgi:hypothetical protein